MEQKFILHYLHLIELHVFLNSHAKMFNLHNKTDKTFNFENSSKSL